MWSKLSLLFMPMAYALQISCIDPRGMLQNVEPSSLYSKSVITFRGRVLHSPLLDLYDNMVLILSDAVNIHDHTSTTFADLLFIEDHCSTIAYLPNYFRRSIMRIMLFMARFILHSSLCVLYRCPLDIMIFSYYSVYIAQYGVCHQVYFVRCI